MKLFLQDLENMVGKRANDELSRVRSMAEALLERLDEQSKAADDKLIEELDRIKTGAADLITDIDGAVKDAETLTLGALRGLHSRAQDIGLA